MINDIFVDFWPCSLAVGKNFATSGHGTGPVSILSKGSFSVFSGSNSQELTIFSVIEFIIDCTSSSSFVMRLLVNSLANQISSQTPDISLKLEEINDLRCLVNAHCSQDS